MKKNLWKSFIEFIHRRPVGSVFTRQEMIQELDPRKDIPGQQRTIDLYRRKLSILGFLEIVSRGQYKIRCMPRIDLKSSDVHKAAYGSSWRGWFNDFKEPHYGKK